MKNWLLWFIGYSGHLRQTQAERDAYREGFVSIYWPPSVTSVAFMIGFVLFFGAVGYLEYTILHMEATLDHMNATLRSIR